MQQDFQAEDVIADLRAGNRPDEAGCLYINQYPRIDELRAIIVEDDLPWLVEVIERESGAVARLFVSLTRFHSQRPEIQELLRSRWHNTTPEFRACLMWRILDDPDLPTDWHNLIFLFVLEEWEVFQQEALKFSQSADNTMSMSLTRMGDPGFPMSKKWVYLCSVTAVCGDSPDVRSFIELGASKGDEFTKEVAEAMLKKLAEL